MLSVTRKAKYKSRISVMFYTSVRLIYETNVIVNKNEQRVPCLDFRMLTEEILEWFVT